MGEKETWKRRRGSDLLYTPEISRSLAFTRSLDLLSVVSIRKGRRWKQMGDAAGVPLDAGGEKRTARTAIGM